MDNKKSSPSAQSGRRKSGGSTQLRSPIVKRPSTAPVALQGWLHKQGSEGLMLWKKRWFVLSEYCLFYYKGPEEEKLLGSILLPSYKVSVCTADDKVYRKFAFKAEHVNMRTYYFAAESRELMTQWMNALSLATILQEGTKLPYQDHQNRTSMPSLVKQNSDEFGFQSYNAVSGPITVQPTSQDRNMKDSSANMNGWAGPNPAGPNQPLYANAPPKPKRLNNEGQYGSSPEASPNRRDDAENILYSSRKRFQETLNPARPQEYHYHSYKTGYPSGSIPDADMSRSISHSGTYSGEERSPVNTTWTDVKSTNFIRNMPREEELNSNYSDVFKNSNYNLGPPLRSEGTNFPGYGNSMNSSHANYQHPNQYYQSYQQSPQRQFDLQELESGRLDQGRRYQPPRPHSADFLDYDAKKYYPNKKNMESMIVEKSSGKFDQFNSPRPPRPKSSLDIVPSNDGYYWSEERYAEKMRQSAMYLQNTPTQRSQSSRANTPTARRTNESSALLPDVKNVNEQILANLRQKMTVPTTARQNLRRWSEHQDRIDNTFMRSASARVPKHGTHDDESDEVQAYTGGQDFNEGRKEESMKRLLEWKQRMLQSPLTRKLSGSSTRGVAQNELSKSYKQQVLKELEKQEAKSREDLGKRKSKADGSRIQNRMSDSRRSAILSSDRYYSYSSDDEENEKISEERTRKTSQSRKSRKEVEDSKGRKTVTNPGILKTVNFASPNYENIKQSHDSEGRYTVYEIESLEKDPDVEDKVMTKKPRIVRSEAGSKSEQSQSARGSHPLPLAEKSGSGRRSLGNSDAELGIQPTHYDHKVQQYKKPNWNEKIDETKLIKEFSYQYIKDPHSYESDPANNNSTTVNNSSAEVLPENIVKSRVKQLEQIDPESSGSDGIKEPLKVSSPNYYLNEAHISSLKHSDGTEKSQEVKKPIGKSQSVETSPQKPQEQANTEMPERHQKSVKDLLADFERKSQLAQEREEHEKSFEEVPGKRCVFSDTETLLYDTSSDTEDKKREPDASILSGLKKSETRRIEDDLTEEEDRDEEVSAALGKRERYFSSGRDSGRKRESDFLQRGKRLSKPLPAEPSPSSDVETTITPGYLGSTMPDSTAPVENSDSTCSTPTIERIKDNLEKTLPKENWTKKAQEVVKEEENCEGHYMPMTPSRRVSAPSSDKSRSTSSLQSFPYGGDAEETYVEMTENLVEPNKSSLSRIRKSFTDQHIPNYCEVTGNDSVPHYDFLYRSGMLSEPEYMEVNTLLEILKEQDEKLKERKDAVVGKSDVKSDQDFAPPTPPRSALPDILNSSASQQALKSDSSDADDESSKDLDSLDIPRHPRFSLSDTFRPASYYLGSAINGRDRSVIRLPNPNENHDSSDSDLVSPPPIPTSPPPLDDLDTSLETERSVEIKLQNLTKYKLMGKDGSKKLWNASGSSQDAETDEDTKKKKRRPVSEDMLDTLEEAEQFFYEKPLVFSELDSIGSRNGLALDEDINDINLDQYLEELQLNGSMNAQLYTKDFSENIYKSSEKEIHKNLMSKESVNKMNPTEKSLLKLTYPNEQNKVNDDGTSHERSKSLEEAQYENLQTLFPPPPPELYESSNEQSDRESSLAMYRTAPFPEVPPPDNYCDVCDPVDQNKVCFDPDTLQHQVSSPENATAKSNGCFEPQGAPYYYSDIIKNDDADFGNSNPEKSSLALRGSRYQPLNNQRDNPQEVSQCSKRNDIGRKVNPISQNYLAQGNQPDEMDDVQKITAELRTTSAHFMGAADKSGTVDARNIYESDTLQRRKGGTTAQADESRVRTPDMHHPQGVARNLYPQGLKDKSPGISAISNLPHGKFLANTHNRERSRSVDGLLNEPGQFSAGENVELGTTERVPENVTNVANSSMNQSCEGEDLWDKDTLWRENLRKVSLRHTRSLDNLDDDITWNSGQRLNASEKVENPDKFQSGRRSVDHFADTRKSTQSGRRSADHFSAVANRNKVSRNVTYVNDTIRPNKSVDLISEYEEDYREGRIRSRKKESDIQRVVELSDSGVLDCDDGVHYEKLTRTPKRSGEVNFDYGYDWERQRDMFKRDQPVGKEVSPRGKASFLVEGASDDSTPVAQSPGNEGLALEPLDREKLRQWDLMSSGTVEQEVEQRKFDQQEVEKDSNLKKHEDPPSDADIGEYVVMERRSREKQPMEVTQNLEASGSGSVMREVHLPSSSSTLPQMGRQAQKVSLRVTPSPSGLNEESLGSNQKLNQLGRSLPDFIDRTEYYDRGKGFITMQNGYDERNDGYGTRREDVGGGEDRTSSSSERGRALDERNYYVDQYQDRKLGGYHRNSGSLLMNKNGVTKPSSPMNVLTSPMSRAAESQDGRYLGKENLVKRKVSSSPWGLDVSAGELLGRTHEELVLLLIQLRRQSASVCKAMESCHIEIEEQARLAELDTPKRMEHIRKLEKLKKHLLELEKQYEKGKPLVNLVDNMVKLGSLYKGNNHAFNGGLSLEHSPNVREKLEFNQKVQEQRLLAEERRDWDRLSSDHGQLQAKVQQLYKLDRLLQEESGTLHILQQDKELLEKALGGLRHKLQVNRSNPVEADRCRKQQKLIEKELSRVRLLLAHNSKKLEETVAENARLEQELVILRQKLQASRVSSRSSMPILPESTTLSTTAALEAELRRVQQLVGDLQRQRHELSAQVKQLTEKSDTLVQQIRPGPTGVAGAGPIPGKKKSSATWLETDLDLLITQDVGVESQVTSPQQQQQPMLIPGSRSTTPIYINTETSKKDALSPTEDSNRSIVNKPSPVEELQTKAYCTPVELSEADERMKRFYGIIPKEKQEIKTVRIVKRESERRQRDRDRSGNIGIPIGNMAVAKRVSVIDENDSGGLGRVDEEGYDNMHNPQMFNNYIEEQKLTDYRSSDEAQDPFMNFHPTNPFLPHNLADNLNEDVLVVDMDPVTSPGKRSQSLPRGFGKTGMPNQPPKYEGPPALRNAMSKRNRVRFDTQSQEGSGSESGPNSPRSDNSSKNYGGCRTHPNDYSAGRKNSKSSEACQSFSPNGSCGPAQVVRGLRLYSEQQREHEAMRKEKIGPEIQTRPLTAREQLFGSGYSLNDEPSPQLSPVYQSEAAREIIMEMSGMPVKRPLNRRPIRKEKRRHHTVSNIRHVTDSESHLSRMGSARSRDDLDMERALRPRMNAPDVVRSTMNHKDLKYNESTIDSILGTPNKIVIPERYIPEQEMLTAEEQMQRSRKAESIRKMLSETTAISTPDLSSEGLEEERKSCTLRKKVEEEKKQREHLLELNQILAQQVMEKSKLVAGSISAPSHQQD